MIEEILNEIIKEARNGQVVIDNETWPIAFNTIIYEGNTEKILWDEKNNIILRIKDKKRVVELLEEYIDLEIQKNRKSIAFINDKERNRIKWLISYLFVNATTEDFLIPERLISRYIAFLKDKTFNTLENGIEIRLNELFENRLLRVIKKTNSTSMETPYRIDVSIVEKDGDNEVTYNLPSVYYGICNDKCYIYCVMTPRKKIETEQEEKLRKKINRTLYKINKDLEKLESSEYYDYKEGKSSYYPEDNISDVTNSFLFSINTFLSLLEVKKKKKVKVITYLPLRYQSREIATREKDDDIREELERRNDLIQANITEKIIRTFRRLSYENPDVEIENYPYEVDAFLSLNIGPTYTRMENPVLTNTGLNVKISAIPSLYDGNIRK